MNVTLLLVLLLSPMFLAVVAKALGANGIKKSKEEIKLFVGWPTRIVMSYFVLVPVAIFLIDPQRTWSASLLLALLALPLVLNAWFVEIRISNEGLLSRSPWRRSRRIAWHEIVSVGKVSNGGGWAWDYVETNSKQKIRWDGLIDGGEYISWALDRFAPAAPRKTSKFLER